MSNSPQIPTKSKIEGALTPLIGLKLSIARLGADMRGFHFGEIRPYAGSTAGQYALHIQGPWRIESETEIVTGRSDLRNWKFGRHRPGNWNYEMGGNLQDALLAKLLKGYDEQTRSLINVTDQLVVQRIEVTPFGDAMLYLSGSYRLVLFPTSRFDEAWRVFQPTIDDGEVFAIGNEDADRGFTPVTTSDYLERAEQRFWGNDRTGAIADCSEAIRLEPQNSRAYTQRGRYRDEPEEGDDYAGAIADFTEAIRLDPRNDEAYWRRAMIYEYNKDDYEAAIADYTEALRIDPYLWGYLSRGFCYWMLDQNEAAIADFTQSIELEPSVDGYIRRAQSRYELDDLSGAFADCVAAIGLAPESSSAYYLRGNIRDDMGDLDGAIEDFTKALDRNDRNEDAYNGRAWARYRKGDYDAALSDADAAIRFDIKHQKSWEYFHTRGMIYGATNQVVRAISDFQSALDLEPRDPEEIQHMTDYIAKWVRAAD